MNKPLRNVTTKLNSNVRKALATATIKAESLAGFDHFSYQADWSNFPNSLMISCHFQADHRLENTTTIEAQLSKLLQLSLLKQGIKFRDVRKNITIVSNPLFTR
tara:strand:- start:2034 stop:2345 length:312 start_codon:yes stop_codon:yes gene_type:complete